MSQQQTTQQAIQKSLALIQKHFYHKKDQKSYYQDQKQLTYAITWPAAWLHQRGLNISPQQYEQLIANIIHNIIRHGNINSYSKYFPAYLLKAIQTWFIHHGDQLCHSLRHIRNQLWNVDQLIHALQNAPPNTSRYLHHIQSLAQAHLILKGQKQRKKVNPTHTQLKLF